MEQDNTTALPQSTETPLISRVIWEKEWRERVCVKIPFDGTKCLEIVVAVRIIEDNKQYFVELQLFGERRRFGIANVCYPVFTVGIGSLTVCTSNVEIGGGRLAKFTLSVNGCIGAKIGPINVRKCWKLFDQTIVFFHFDLAAVGTKGLNGEEIIEGYNDIAYIEE